jgi:phosphoglycerol transferase MdoB-like AlkP superfamily enzyme
MGVSSAGEPSRRKAADRIAELLVRVVLVVGAMVLLRFAESRYVAWRQEGTANFHYQLSGWLLWVGLAALAGLAFGLAGWMPWGRMRFRWTRALLLGVVPLILLTLLRLWFGGVRLPSSLWRAFSWLDTGPQFVLATLLGVAVASGFAPRTERPRSEEGLRS